MGVEPADALALEDSLNGAKSAQGAGMQGIGVTADPVLAERMGLYMTERVAALAELLDKDEFFRMA